MALAIDASTPAFVVAGADPWTSASFTPPVDSLLVVCVPADWFGSATVTITVTSTGLTFTSQTKQGAENQGLAQIFTAEVGSNGGTARTVSVTTSLGANADSGGVKVYVFTGQHATLYVDAVAGGSNVTTNNFTGNITTGFDGCWVVGCGSEWQNLGAATSTDTYENGTPGGIAPIAVRKATATATAGSVGLNFDAFGTGTPLWTWAAISIRPAAGGTGATVTPGAIATVAAVPQATPAVSDVGAPAATAVTVGAPQATPSVADTAAPGVITATVTLPQATPATAGNATAVPATITAMVSLPQAIPSAGVTVSPAATAAVTALPQAGIAVGAGPASIPVTVTLPQATPQAGGNTTATPSTIATTVTVPQSAINVTAGPTVVQTTVTLPQATAAIPATTTPLTIPVAVTLPAAGLNTAAGPVTVSAAVTLPAAGLSVAAGPTVIPVVVTLPQATGVDEGAQVNGTSTAQVLANGTSVAVVSALAAVAVTQRGSSTSTVSDG